MRASLVWTVFSAPQQGHPDRGYPSDDGLDRRLGEVPTL